MNTTKKQSTKQVLKNYFAAGFPCIAIQTSEEARAMAEVLAAAAAVDPPRAVLTWSATEGLVPVGGKPVPDTEDLQAALMQKVRPETVTVLRDAHVWPFDRVPPMLRAFRDYVSAGPAVGSCVVVLGPSFEPHPTVAKLVTVMDFELPDADALREIAEGSARAAVESKVGDAARLAVTDDIVKAAGGMTTSEAENAMALSIIETGGLDAAIVYREKVKAVRRSGLLTVIDADPRGMDAVGGLDVLKTWIAKRRRVWSPEAEAFGLPSPKGIALIGLPGCGKSLVAKCIGSTLGVPTLSLDIGSLFNSLIGESEARTREALKLAEAQAPCVLVVEEIEKALAGAGDSGGGDSGVGKRVFGTILTWLQERKRPVFLIASANKITGLPPELFRKGRFDEIFAVDLPNPRERLAILGLQLDAKGRASEALRSQRVVDATEGFTGSEIEAVVDEAMFRAFDAGHDLELDDLVWATGEIVPLCTTAKEQVDALREWAQGRARFASAAEETTTTVTAARTRRLAS